MQRGDAAAMPRPFNATLYKSECSAAEEMLHIRGHLGLQTAARNWRKQLACLASGVRLDQIRFIQESCTCHTAGPIALTFRNIQKLYPSFVNLPCQWKTFHAIRNFFSSLLIDNISQPYEHIPSRQESYLNKNVFFKYVLK